jgi:hypothetical protein
VHLRGGNHLHTVPSQARSNTEIESVINDTQPSVKSTELRPHTLTNEHPIGANGEHITEAVVLRLIKFVIDE